jgi:uncharacterized protein YhfF
LFKREHINAILSGKKTATRRDWKRRQAKIGGIYPVQGQMFQRREAAPAFIYVWREVRRERLGDMTESDAAGEGGYSLEEFRGVWREINGDWDPDLEVFVVEFVCLHPDFEPRREGCGAMCPLEALPDEICCDNSRACCFFCLDEGCPVKEIHAGIFDFFERSREELPRYAAPGSGP